MERVNKLIVFISTMDGCPWGGSEELWSRAALVLANRGWAVAASVHGFSPPHARVMELIDSGVEVEVRHSQPVWRRISRKLLRRQESPFMSELRPFLCGRIPALVVISNGNALPPIEVLELCVARKMPYVSIGQANLDAWWPNDDLAARYRKALSFALRCQFVSEANRRLAEKQIGAQLPNAEVVRNPFNVAFDAAPSWPSQDGNGEVRFASVARLHPPSKGQDILLEALASELWRDRDWRLSFYGEGPCRESLARLVTRLDLDSRVEFAGHVADVAGIWKRHHALVLPSRYEGMPLALVEAMLCGRAAIATDVAGHAEIIDDGVTGFLADAPTVRAMAGAMEKAWERRSELREIGKVAASRIRKLIPSDPGAVLAQQLESLISMNRAF